MRCTRKDLLDGGNAYRFPRTLALNGEPLAAFLGDEVDPEVETQAELRVPLLGKADLS
jgi:hypothetical protein